MHGSIPWRPGELLAAIVLSIAVTPAMGQVVGYPEYASTDGQAYAVALPSVAAASYEMAPDKSLEGRIAELEDALGKMKKKEAAEKKLKDAAPSVKVFGRIHWDWEANNQDEVAFQQVNQPDGDEFRRARIGVRGEAFHVIEYKFEVDFADTNSVASTTGGTATIQSTAFKDVYIEIKELPYVGFARVGHFKEPFGLEQLTSTNYITFMERSTSDQSMFVPARHNGVMLHNYSKNERMTWAVGGFVDKDTEEPPIWQTNIPGGMSCTTRATWLPWYDEATEGRGLLHTGVGYTHRDMFDDRATFSTRPEAHLCNNVINFTLTDVPSWQALDLELAMVYGPFSAQAEFYNAFVARSANPDAVFQGMYAYFSYFLTGEHRPYDRLNGVFTRVKPYENFFRVRGEDNCIYTGKGAWELAYRFSYVDTRRDGVEALAGSGIVADHTIGVNWYLNPYTRIMFNYVNSELVNNVGLGYTNIYEMRFQIDF